MSEFPLFSYYPFDLAALQGLYGTLFISNTTFPSEFFRELFVAVLNNYTDSADLIVLLMH